MIAPGSGSTTLGLAIGCALAAVLLQAGQNAGTQGQPVFRVTTRLVVLNVVVHDKKGAPVTGLTRADFSILDGGKREKITVFSVESGHAGQRRERPLPSNVYSNRLSREGGVVTNVAAILIDGQDTTFEDQAYARQQVAKFLTQLQPRDRVALYALGSRLRVIQDFTDDPAALLAALGRLQGRVRAAQAEASSPGLETESQMASGPTKAAQARFEVGISDLMVRKGPVHAQSLWNQILPALQAIANHLAGLPGRKSLIWLTGAVPFPQYLQDFRPGHPGGSSPLVADRIHRTIELLNQDDVALYPVDARGLLTDPAFSAQARGRAEGIGGNLAAVHGPIEAMIYYAQQTGGRAFYNTNDLKGALRKALDDSEVTYTLGYYPTHGRWDGRYRPIKVLVDRKGVEVRHRQGYFARAEQVVEEKDRIALLKEEAQDPLDATGLGLTVKLDRYKGAAGEQLKVNVYVDARDLKFRLAKGLWTASFDVWAAQYSNQGDSLGGVSKTVSANLKGDNYRKILRAGGVNLTIDEKAEHGAAELRVVVRDAPSGALGSVRIPLHNSL